MRWNTLDEFTEFASWFGQTREHFGSDVIKDLENENFYSSGNAVCVCVCMHARAILSGHQMNGSGSRMGNFLSTI